MTHPTFGDDPRLAALTDATAKLVAPGAPFEIITEVVLGESVEVFARRHRSLRDVLVAGGAFGDAECYVFADGRRITYTNLLWRVAAVARLLTEDYGLRPGDRVAIAAANCPEWVVTFWAATCSGLVVVAMNGWWTGGEMVNALALAEPALVVVDDKRADRLGSPACPVARVGPHWAGEGAEEEGLDPPAETAEDDPALLIFTSGTTGRPKAAVLSHRAVVGYLMLQSFLGARSAVLAGSNALRVGAPVRLAPYPLFHVSGLSMMVGSVMTGAKTVWPVGRFDPAAIIELTRQEGVGVWGGGTTHIIRLLEAPELDSLPAGQIVSVGVGGSATAPDVVRRVEERFPHLEGTMTSGYGSTETGGLASWAPAWMLAAAPDCVGPVLPTVQVRVTDDAGEVLPDSREGNVEIRSAYTMSGYWRHPEADAEVVRPGRWVRSGDFGRLEQGVLFIAARRRDLIIRGGENVYPFEIEYRLCEHPSVVESAVFGVDDATYGQRVKAVVVTRPEAVVGAEELREFCAEALAYYKIPDEIEVRTEPLPRNATGKVMKHVLSGAAESGFSAEQD